MQFFNHFFHIFFLEFGFLDSRLDLLEFFKCMTWQSFFLFIVLFIFSFSCSHGLSTPGNDVCHRWPSKLKRLFSCEDCFERLVFWSNVVYIIFVQKEDYGSKVFSKMDNFWSTCPKASIKDDFEVSRSWDLRFWSLREFWRAWSCNKSWCIPNYQLSVFFKNSSFFVAWFRRIQEEVFKSGILWPVAWAGMIKWFIRFFKIVPLRAPLFLFKWFHSERKCLLRWVHYQQ